MAPVRLASALVVCVIGMATTGAREASPGTIRPATPSAFDPFAVPRPEECLVASRAADPTLALLHDVYAGLVTPLPVGGALIVKGGPLVDVRIDGVLWTKAGRVGESPPAPFAGAPVAFATVDGLTTRVRERTACFNAGEVPRLSHHGDDF